MITFVWEWDLIKKQEFTRIPKSSRENFFNLTIRASIKCLLTFVHRAGAEVILTIIGEGINSIFGVRQKNPAKPKNSRHYEEKHKINKFLPVI